MASKTATKSDEKAVFVPKSAAELQKIRLNKLMSNPDKPVVIPDRPEEKLPRVFNPPEFVRNIWGSSAGAGSGDFHVYRGVRRREYARQKHLDQEQIKNDLDAAHQAKVERNRKEAEERTAKKRAKRQKKKMKQKMKKFKMTHNKEQGKEESAPAEEESDEDEDQEFEESVKEGARTETGKASRENEGMATSSKENEQASFANSEETDEDDDAEQERDRKARLASQPEDADDNSNSEDETES